MLATLLELMTLLGPAIAGLLTVPILNAIKRLSTWVDNTPAVVKQMLAIVIAFVLTKGGELINTALPTDLALFTGESLEALIAAGIAYGVHAGRKKVGAS